MRHSTIVLFLTAMVLAACSGDAGTSGQPLPTVVLSSGTTQLAVERAGVAASGIVVAAQEAHLSFSGTGTVEAVRVRLGDKVEAGAVLIELDDAAAQRDLARAVSELTDLTSPAGIARAQQDVAAADEVLQTSRTKLEYYITPAVLYWEERLADSESALATAKATAGSTPTDEQQKAVSDAEKAVARAQANLTYAEKQLREVYLPEKFTRVNSVTGEEYVAEPRIDTEAARADYALAAATLDEAQAYLAVLSGEVPASEAANSRVAHLEWARRSEAVARAALEGTRLTAPFAGTIAFVSTAPGENAVPGAIVVIVSDLSRLHVETTDLSELDVTKVKVGQAVRVYFEALDKEADGRVAAIAPGATMLGGDVVYKAVIDLDAQPAGLRPGMSAEVSFEGAS
jgi:multidrug efflux pump subunit AcrA (membrane-fusion protein)